MMYIIKSNDRKLYTSNDRTVNTLVSKTYIVYALLFELCVIVHMYLMYIEVSVVVLFLTMVVSCL